MRLKIYLISQDTVQFDAICTDKNSIISNCHIQVMFPPNRLETAKYISQMLGETTVATRQFSVSGKRAAMMHGQVTESVKTDKRPLLTPDEVMALPRSYDARYFGVQETRQIVEVLAPVWTW